MVGTESDICNLALDLLGTKNINNIDEGTENALLCKKWYDNTRQSLLTNINASLSFEREALAVDASNSPVYMWDYQYLLPNDCLKVLNVDESLSSQDWAIEGAYLVSNTASVVYIRYIKNITAVNLFDATFIELLALQLAVNMCIKATQDFNKAKILKSELKEKYIEASQKYGSDNKIRIVRKSKFEASKQVDYGHNWRNC